MRPALALPAIFAALLLAARPTPAAAPRGDYAIFAGGCFWCLQPPFDQREGVSQVLVGYSGGRGAKPSYRDYAAKGHLEAIRVSYDPAKVSYAELLELFLRQIDPGDGEGQFVDRGPQYRPAIFWRSEEQKRQAQRALRALEASGRFARPLRVELLPEAAFTPAEDYHQGFYLKSPQHFRRYREGAGRDRFLAEAWGRRPTPTPAPYGKGGAFRKPSKQELRSRLGDLACHVTQEDGTEPPFANAYWDEHREGLYVDAVSGEPLFSSRDKFDSGTGWPSFTRPLRPGLLAERRDRKLGLERTEVRSRLADSHLGHVFPDGPAPTGLRYCINSAALRFVPRGDLEREGYGAYSGLFGPRGANAP